jgi:alpha-D-ribose 1-methylphosphonate 5-triphosphate synthase subunit PhnH
MSAAPSIDSGAGFADPVRDAQECYRAIMSAFAQPGTIVTPKASPQAPVGLSRAMTCVALTLCDYETPVWLDATLRTSRPVTDYVRLQTGSRLSEAPGEAAFAFASSWQLLPQVGSFSLGTLAFPDASTTIVLEVPELEPVAGWHLTGPGIASRAVLKAGPLPSQFETALQANRRIFPRGVDFILCCGDRLAALPRTTRIARGS